jgi:hypothetical protein
MIYNVPPYITLHYITLHYITLHYITLHYITLHYITLHYITLHYIHYILSSLWESSPSGTNSAMSHTQTPQVWVICSLSCSRLSERLDPAPINTGIKVEFTLNTLFTSAASQTTLRSPTSRILHAGPQSFKPFPTGVAFS